MSLAATCKQVYGASKYMYRNHLVTISESNKKWVKKYKPKLVVKDIKYIEFPNIYTLDLTDNQLTSLPESIGQLKNLIYLDLSCNQLTSLPESIGQLKNLTNLDLGNNQLTSAPGFISQLKNLTHLNLTRNQITSLPPQSIAQLKNLTHLYLNRNQITNLSEIIGQLNNVTQVCIMAEYCPVLLLDKYSYLDKDRFFLHNL
jgi:Leucine-rich repeat (LRR) protein